MPAVRACICTNITVPERAIAAQPVLIPPVAPVRTFSFRGSIESAGRIQNGACGKLLAVVSRTPAYTRSQPSNIPLPPVAA